MNQPNLFQVADHSNLGKKWEADLETVHSIYRLRKLADIVKNAEKWVYCGREDYDRICVQDKGRIAIDGNGRYIKKMPSDIDFSGGGKALGRMICFDAKATGGDRFPLPMLKLHQIIRLGESARCGNLAGFMILMAKYNRVFFMPQKVADAKWAAHEASARTNKRALSGTASWTIGELEKTCAEIFFNKTDSVWDWLRILA